MNGIVKAELIVRTKDWHPVQKRLEVRGENETRSYELTETAFEVLSLNTLGSSIFEDLSPSSPQEPIVQAQKNFPILRLAERDLWADEI